MKPKSALRMAIDIGGTFTDTVLMDDLGRVIALTKTLTAHGDPSEGALEGAHRVPEISGCHIEEVSGFIHGTTLATNAPIEKRGASVATIATEGFRDILEIAYGRGGVVPTVSDADVTLGYCRKLRVTSRGFRALRVRPMSQRQRDDMVILAHIREQHCLSL